jgi:hypothetical protein
VGQLSRNLCHPRRIALSLLVGRCENFGWPPGYGFAGVPRLTLWKIIFVPSGSKIEGGGGWVTL